MAIKVMSSVIGVLKSNFVVSPFFLHSKKLTPIPFVGSSGFVTNSL